MDDYDDLYDEDYCPICEPEDEEDDYELIEEDG